MTQVFEASTLFQVMTLAAAIEAGHFDERADGDRLLLVCGTTMSPEAAPELFELPAFAPLARHFDRVISYNGSISPFHPSHWMPASADLPMVSALLRDRWGLGAGPVELVLESIQVRPARTLAALFPDTPVTVFADGLMVYGPTRDQLPVSIARRAGRLLYLDLVEGLRPLLLMEAGARHEPVEEGAFRKVVDEVAAVVLPPEQVAAKVTGGVPRPGHALLIGQYLADLDILTAEEEEALHVEMLAGAVARGHRQIVFKPHPAAGRGLQQRLQDAADELGVELLRVSPELPVEAWYATQQPGLVVGCFSTGLMTASRFFGIPVARTGTGRVLRRLTPYQNSNRIPATIIDACVAPVAGGRASTPPTAEVEPLVRAVGYCMQSASLPQLRDDAVTYLSRTPIDVVQRYFRGRRLSALGLPGGRPPQPVLDQVRAAVRWARKAGVPIPERRPTRQDPVTGGIPVVQRRPDHAS
jgi:hypothetical protein